ncbi:hypothetical protein KC921_03615 [Candidatus Woesebacteria bacterium]|nr:hypothetical protein [Candidatus Woesebacteria bacterium]
MHQTIIETTMSGPSCPKCGGPTEGDSCSYCGTQQTIRTTQEVHVADRYGYDDAILIVRDVLERIANEMPDKVAYFARQEKRQRLVDRKETHQQRDRALLVGVDLLAFAGLLTAVIQTVRMGIESGQNQSEPEFLFFAAMMALLFISIGVGLTSLGDPDSITNRVFYRDRDENLVLSPEEKEQIDELAFNDAVRWLNIGYIYRLVESWHQYGSRIQDENAEVARDMARVMSQRFTDIINTGAWNNQLADLKAWCDKQLVTIAE